ncbi:hypothetical protein QFZ82_000547 [Streptomyces sp. V4I23]|uniref:hypothetical protein n=1 Tax=Streptomyces sp. V4I23 TaxID=3042282 RepID=UPI002786DF35|nr:hypothetical protein [Streptomyces sp. V4I23]MDQ1006062.1 hypothetical protein [Streptomyces sp. V4I23]
MRSRRQRGRVIAACAAAVAFLLAFPSALPNSGRRLGSLLESFLPWRGLAVSALLAAALLRRSATALAVVLLPVRRDGRHREIDEGSAPAPDRPARHPRADPPRPGLSR